MRRITSTDLANWAPTRDCQEHLPLLLRKLIRASVVNVQKILIPAGDNVILPGYDGTVEVISGTEYIPTGISVWEIGSNKDFKDKAEREFKKRSNEADIAAAANISFVFVTPYVWSDKEKWLKEKDEQKIWKNVRVIDGQVLEEWIEHSPSVGAWLAKFLQIPFANIQPLDQFWEEWSTNLKYSISSTLVVSGRENDEKRLSDFLLDTPKILSIKAFTVQEAIAFCSAAIERMESDLREGFLSKTIIIEDEKDFRLVSCHRYQLILIVKFEAGSLTDQAIRNGHHVILPIGNDVTAANADIELPRIKRTGFEKGLEIMGFTSEEAEQLTRDSGQSLSVLRRLLEFEKNQQPAWAKDGHHSEILPALLAGMWDEQKDEDKSIIALLAGEPYEKNIAKLSRWKIENDPPLLQVKTIWRMTSAFDSWSILSPFLTKPDLENFKTAFLAVLPEINPALALDPEKRYLASLYGKTPKFSYSLKEGLCQSLILMAVFGDQFKLGALDSPQGFADILVHDLLFEATGDKWCTLYRLLPLLSEASPKSFLKAVEDSLSKADPPIMKMFGDTENFLNSTSYYTGLLWALENLLVSPDYLLKATLVLGKLARLDPGGNLQNRPKNSLREAYMPWYNQTGADFTLRKYVLNKLIEKEPEVAWSLLLSISPQDHAVVSPIHKCKWRFDAQHLERSVMYEEIWDFNSYLFEKLIFLAANNEKRTSVLVNFYPNLNNKDRETLLTFLTESKNTYDYTQDLIWDELRCLLSRHREHSNQNWALPANELDKIEEVFNHYNPKDLKRKYKFLFEESWPYFPEGVKRKQMTHDEREEMAEERRGKALIEIYQSEGLKGIYDLLKELTNAYPLAATAAKFKLSSEDEDEIFSLLENDQASIFSSFSQNYIFRKAITDNEWAKISWRIVKEKFQDEQILATFFLSLPQKRVSWALLDTAPESVSNIYWQKINPLLYNETYEDKLYVINKLLGVNRHITLIDKVAYISEEISSKELADILYNAATVKSEETLSLDSYDVGRIFKTLHSRNDLPKNQLIQLEWYYLPFLNNAYGNHKPQNLLAELAANPDFFVEVVSYVYRPDDGIEETQYSEEELTRRYQQANSARNLLDSWKDIPGAKEDGTIDKKILTDWVMTSRLKAKEKHRVYGVDCKIGKLLASYPRKKEKDTWPPDEICEIIDAINSDTILSHFRTEIFNSRGVSVRSPFTGGGQERSLAAYFEGLAKKIRSKYPFTASALFELARGYERDAKEEDDRAHLDELR